MPTYHYRCKSCAYEFDQVQSMMDEPLTTCPKCEGSIMRIIQPVGIQFKGSGFYVNDKNSKSNASE
ncbi:MAG: FmdB family zinc ribbon protein [Candidatus Marinamargulisbacteria bacterium]